MLVSHKTPPVDAAIGMGCDTDGCPRYKGANPLYYEIVVCPFCHFAAYREDFGGIDLALVEEIAKGLSADKRALAVDFSQAERSIFAALRSYELATKSYDLRQAKGDMMGGLALRSAWICRYSGQLSREVAFMTQAVGFYREALFSGIRSDKRLDNLPITFLIGELQLRCGQVEEAIQFFERMEGTVDAGSEIGIKTAERLAEARRAFDAVSLLQGIPLFQPMPEASLGLLGVNSRNREYKDGEALCKLGEPGDAMFVISGGEAAVIIGGNAVAVLGPGQAVGEMALLTGAPRTADVLARMAPGTPAEDPAATVLEISVTAFRHLLKVCPEVMDGLARMVAQRQAENAARAAGGAPAGVESSLAAVTASLQQRFDVPSTAGTPG
jgi:CRP-like cAMP-binding protein